MCARRRDDETRKYDDDRPRRSGRKRRREQASSSGAWIALGAVALLLVAAGVSGLVLRSKRGDATPSGDPPPPPGPAAKTAPASGADLDAAIAEADKLDPGWRFAQLMEKRAAVPAGENSAPLVSEANRLLPRDNQPTPEWLDLASATRLDEAQQAELQAWLKARAATLRVALRLADRPRGRYDLKLAPDYISTLLPHVQDARRVANVIQAEAMRRAEAGEPGRLDEFRALLNSGRSIGDEPLQISQMVRGAIGRVAVLSLERTLARTTPGEEPLAAAQARLADEAGYPALLTAWRGERGFEFGMLEAVDTGVVAVAKMTETFRSFQMNLEWPADAGPGSAGLKSSHAWNLRYRTELVEAAKKPTAELAAAVARARSGEAKAPPAARLLLGMGEAAKLPDPLQSFQRHEALLRAAVVAVAAERYRLKHGRWPLEAKEIGGELPADPFDGAPMRFRRLDDGLVVYSIGPNGRDDGGDLGDRREPADIGFRLWDAERRR